MTMIYLNLRSLFLIMVVAGLVQGCNGVAPYAPDENFGSWDRKALVVFGVANANARGWSRANFVKIEAETKKVSGSCLGGKDEISVQPPPKDSVGTNYQAFRVPAGIYVSSRHTEVFSVAWSFQVESGMAYYLADLVYRSPSTVEVQQHPNQAAQWFSTHEKIRVPMELAPLEPYDEPIYHFMCTI